VRPLIAAVLAVAACSTSPDHAFVPSEPVSAALRQTPVVQSASYRTECARDVLSSFIDAFDRGDTAQLNTFFSATDGSLPFQWFYTPETKPYGPDLAHLVEVLAAWHAEGERWRLVSVTSGDGPSWHGGVDFALTITRSWRDHLAVNNGKGALDCSARKIFVLALGPAVEATPSGRAGR
jgi:hypothetical protein